MKFKSEWFNWISKFVSICNLHEQCMPSPHHTCKSCMGVLVSGFTGMLGVSLRPPGPSNQNQCFRKYPTERSIAEQASWDTSVKQTTRCSACAAVQVRDRDVEHFDSMDLCSTGPLWMLKSGTSRINTKSQSPGSYFNILGSISLMIHPTFWIKTFWK